MTTLKRELDLANAVLKSDIINDSDKIYTEKERQALEYLADEKEDPNKLTKVETFTMG